jgi:hypothetical protein
MPVFTLKLQEAPKHHRVLPITHAMAHGGVYGRIPVKDELGRDQRAMFRTWNPDPVQNHMSNLKALDPALAKVVRKAQADNPDLRFVIGSGLRDGRLQRQAIAWGWSKALDSPHDQDGRWTCGRSTTRGTSTSIRKLRTRLQPQ